MKEELVQIKFMGSKKLRRELRQYAKKIDSTVSRELRAAAKKLLKTNSSR